MEDYSNRRRMPRKSCSSTVATASTTTTAMTGGDSDTEADLIPEDLADPVIWGTLDKGFRQVQTVLDRNRLLIQQVNENHHSRVPENMVKNVALIQELNGNISKVVSLYSDLSTNFSNGYYERSKESGATRQIPKA